MIKESGCNLDSRKEKTVITGQDKIQNVKVDTKSEAHTEVLVTRTF